MHGVATASGAITFVNALATGIGAAAAVTLDVEAEVDLEVDRRPGPGAITIAPPSDTPLVRAAVGAALERFAAGGTPTVQVRIRSSIPPACGLKSSSAVSGAVLAAVARAVGVATDAATLARMSADLSQRIGLSATGAFDDAFAALAGGAVITDNAARAVLWSGEAPTGLAVLLWIPTARHRPSTEWHDRFRARAAEARPAIDAALGGDLVRAMERNSELVESVLGYDYGELRRCLAERGATASGVSGLGPALVVLAAPERAEAVRNALASRGGEVRGVEFRPRARFALAEEAP
ncbi:MAG: shikimate kinase [Thermoplasmata archaeon]|nr:shikimate kinase [Thermoplasmata archaeon]